MPVRVRVLLRARAQRRAQLQAGVTQRRLACLETAAATHHHVKQGGHSCIRPRWTHSDTSGKTWHRGQLLHTALSCLPGDRVRLALGERVHAACLQLAAAQVHHGVVP